MGVYFSCPLAASCELVCGFKSAIVKSIFLDADQQKTTTAHSINLSDQVSQSKILEISRSGLDLNSSRDPHSKDTINQSPRPKMAAAAMLQSPTLDLGSPKHEAAVKLQKVYKSFRTRRKLADCAVLIEQSWWKLLDFAELKHSSISYFDIDKHETAISRWSRARTRAAKVGKGLSKNGKARKLALQHWLEAIDPRHRYGHNLHFYYVKWLHSQSKEPFFYWLDIGEGKEINLVEKCPRSKLQQQCIKYLGPMERKAYEIALEDGKLRYKQTGELLDTTGEPRAKWIFVLSTSRTLYIGKKRKGTFQHSSFLAGGATLAAGRIMVEKGSLKAVWPHSGHYRPTLENFQDLLSFLKENNVHLNNVKLDSAEEKESVRKADNAYLRGNSDDDLGERDGMESEENDIDIEYLSEVKLNSTKEVSETAQELPRSRPVQPFGSKLTAFGIPSNNDLIERLEVETRAIHSDHGTYPPDSLKNTYETGEEVGNNLRPNLFSKDHSETGGAKVSKDSTLGKLTPSKRSKPCQFRKQLSGTWSTGAGPRIGCLRDYPSELKSHALEEANFSPRSTRSPEFSVFSHTHTTIGLNADLRGIPFCSYPEKRRFAAG